MRARPIVAAVALALTSCGTRSAYEQSYLFASSNCGVPAAVPAGRPPVQWPFDYGHAILLHETLITVPITRHQRLENQEFAFVTGQVLRHPPSVPLEEAAIGPRYVTLIPEVVAMFDWAHDLHRQLYDVWAGTACSTLSGMPRWRACWRTIGRVRTSR